MARPDYCPVGNEPCQSMCDEPCNWKGTKQRAQDTALIRQLVEALEGYRRNHNDNQPCDAERAGRARLEGKP